MTVPEYAMRHLTILIIFIFPLFSEESMIIIPDHDTYKVTKSTANSRSISDGLVLIQLSKLKIEDYDIAVKNQQDAVKRKDAISRTLISTKKKVDGTAVESTVYEIKDDDKRLCQMIYFIADGKFAGYFILIVPTKVTGTIQREKLDEYVGKIIEANRWK